MLFLNLQKSENQTTATSAFKKTISLQGWILSLQIYNLFKPENPSKA